MVAESRSALNAVAGNAIKANNATYLDVMAHLALVDPCDGKALARYGRSMAMTS